MAKQSNTKDRPTGENIKKTPEPKAYKIGRDSASGRFVSIEKAKRGIVVENLSGPKGRCPRCGKKKLQCSCMEE